MQSRYTPLPKLKHEGKLNFVNAGRTLVVLIRSGGGDDNIIFKLP